jgi:SRSO17 transposase
VPDNVVFQTKPQLALDMVRHSLTNNILVSAWTCDELYGRDSKFLDGLETLHQNFVAEIPCDTRVWLKPPVRKRRPEKVVKSSRKTGKTKRRGKHPPGHRQGPPPCEAQNLLRYSPSFNAQTWVTYHIKNTDKGPEAWRVKWGECWRQMSDGSPRRACLIIAWNALTGELKYFLSNRVADDDGVSLASLLYVAFHRCSIEQCFHVTKDELGLDHYQLRGWRCLHRHFFITQLTHLFCARVRQQFDTAKPSEANRLTVEQVRAAANCWLASAGLPRRERQKSFEKELRRQQYHRRRNEQARRSHTKTRLAKLRAKGIHIADIPTCLSPTAPHRLN